MVGIDGSKKVYARRERETPPTPGTVASTSRRRLFALRISKQTSCRASCASARVGASVAGQSARAVRACAVTFSSRPAESVCVCVCARPCLLCKSCLEKYRNIKEC